MSYTQEDIHRIVAAQREYFHEGKTLDVSFRIAMLKKLKQAIIEREEELEEALFQDLGRCKEEAYILDIGPTLAEINEICAHLKKWAKPEKHRSGLLAFPSTKTKVFKMPYGVSLIISPFNFPVLLTLSVLAYALSGGNTAVVKMSSKSSATTKALVDLIAATFDPRYVIGIDGGHDVADFCLNERFDKIFYTGSPNVAKHVMSCAAANLTPLALELGGETGNWCIVRKDADLRDAARKIAFFKTANSGQICININQIAVAEEIALPFLEALKEAFISQIGEDATQNEEYPKLITSRALKNAVAELEQYKDRIVFGGQADEAKQKLSPTVLYPIGIDEEIVKHELFCPLLPVVPFKDAEVDQLLDVIAHREHGLAFYLFTKDIAWAERVMRSQQYGGGCINEVCLHIMVKGVPFNGVGHSGMGAYHGEWGFREFTHPSTVLYGRTKGNLSLREHPYDEKKLKWLRRFFK